MRVSYGLVVAGLMVAGTVAPAHAQSLLGGIIGGSGDSSLITVSSGSASDSGLVNLGLGGGGGNVADVNVGGSSGSVAIATVNVGGSSGGGSSVSANVLGGSTTANVNVGGSNGTSVNANLLGGAATANVNLGGTNGTGVNVTLGGGTNVNINVGGLPGLPGVPNIPGVPAPGLPVVGDLPLVANAAGGVVRGGGGAAPNCGTDISEQVTGLMDRTSIDASWSQASGVQVQRVEVCPELRNWMSSYLQSNGLGSNMRVAVEADSLISASLDRSSYGADHVFAVKKQGDRLVVFVY